MSTFKQNTGDADFIEGTCAHIYNALRLQETGAEKSEKAQMVKAKSKAEN